MQHTQDVDMRESPTIIEVQGASKTFASGQVALHDVNLSIAQGECVALLGASGSGKSTLLRCICGLERIDTNEGQIRIEGQPLQICGKLSPDIRQIRQKMGIIFQQFNLVSRMRLLSNVLSGMLHRIPLWRSLSAHFTSTEKVAAMQALDLVGLASYAHQRASTLSGGQQQRAAIARTLVQGASIILADEPVASLDPESTRRVMDILKQLNTQQNITVVISLHNVALARQYCDRIVALRDGRIVHDGPPSSFDDVRAHQLYDAQHSDMEFTSEVPAYNGA